MRGFEEIARQMLRCMDEDLQSALYGGTCSSATADPPSQPLTAERLLADMGRIQRELGPPPPAVKIIESAHATEQGGRVRLYPKRKAKSESHWRRMDKKWLKRYGYHRRPCVLQMDTSWLARRPETTFVVHPTLMHGFRRRLAEAGG